MATLQISSLYKGVSQGCPLSPYIFILGIEILSIAIRNHDGIGGINIFGKIIKHTMFADDCTIFLDGTQQSYNNAIYLFEEFGKLSGLTLNFTKCIVLKIGSLRNNRYLVYSKKKGIIWNADNPKALGITFHSQRKDILDLNYQSKINNFYKDIASWNRHKLTTIGNISVFKSFILSKLTYLLSVLPDPPEDILKTLKQKSYEFIWNSKIDKIKRSTIIKNYDEGGLRMTDINYYINSITWVKRLTDPESKGAWKTPYLHELNKYGGMVFFKCNFAAEDVKLLDINNIFLKDVLYSWCTLNFDKNPENIGTQLIWNNSFIKHQLKPIILLEWINKNILYINDIYDFDNNRIKRFTQLQNEFGISRNEYLNYYKLIASISKQWFLRLNAQPKQDNETGESLYNTLTEQNQSNICQYMTKYQVKLKNPNHKKNGKRFFRKRICNGKQYT